MNFIINTVSRKYTLSVSREFVNTIGQVLVAVGIVTIFGGFRRK